MPVTPPEPQHASPFQSFWMGGFEGADHVNGNGQPLDMVASSGHLDRLEEDHRRAAQAGIRCIRESIGWRLTESPGGAIDLSRALRIQGSAHRHGLQVLWTLMHYGLPADLSLHDDAMIGRLARFAAEVARVLGPGEAAAGHTPVYTPVNEISFLSWAASLPGMLAPPNNCVLEEGSAENPRISGYAVKRRLAAAAIAAMHTIRDVSPGSRFLHVDPLLHVVPPHGRDDLAELAAQVRSWQWQGWDMLAGRLEPGLGGRPELLDIVGVNYYHSSQWEVDSEARLDWAERDPRRTPFSELLAEAAARYGRPLVIAETSHVGIGRAPWLHEIAAEVQRARRDGVDVKGLCVYPLVDRPDWQNPADWHRSGLWHVDDKPPRDGSRPMPRYPEPDSLAALRGWQRVFSVPAATSAPTVPTAPVAPDELPRPLLLAFSHLRWDFARHRSRQLLQRLAGPQGSYRLVFVEEPLPASGAPWVDVIAVGPHTTVLVPHTPNAASDGGFNAAQQPLLQALLAGWLAAQQLHPHTLWVTTPMAWPLARGIGGNRVVFDCADELSAFAGAPAALPGLELELLQAADAVVCATETLAAPRRAVAGARLTVLHNGVDRARFGPRPGRVFGWDAMEAAALMRTVPEGSGPLLGYAGAVDERIDLALLQALVDARPQWQWLMVGPVLKIDPQSLPRRPNLHWLGSQPYRLLPALMRRWQVAVLPFAATAATRPSLPLKALEALAAGLPVVTTPLPELRGWRDAGLVCVAGSGSFVDACETALAETGADAAARQRRARARLRRRGWDGVAARLSRWLDKPHPERQAGPSQDSAV